MGAVVLKKKLLYESNLITHKAETFLTVNCSQSVDLCKRKCIYHCVCVHGNIHHRSSIRYIS